MLLDAEHLVSRIKRVLLGWSNCFCLGPASKAKLATGDHPDFFDQGLAVGLDREVPASCPSLRDGRERAARCMNIQPDIPADATTL